MTAAELQDWRARMGYTRPVAADKLGVAPVTFDKYIYNAYPIPEPIAKLCETIEKLTELQTNFSNLEWEQSDN